MTLRLRYAHSIGPAVLLLALLLLAGCGDDNNTGPKDETGGPITVPLAVGNRWVYDVSDSSSALAPRSDYARTDSISGTAVFEGKTYYRLVSRGEEPDTTYLRQEGQKMYLWLSWGGDSPEDSVSAQMSEILEATLPWNVADFEADAGAEWSVAQVSDTISGDGMQFRFEANVRARSLGRSSVTVPSGAYTDVYGMRLIMEMQIELLAGPIPFTRGESRTMEASIKDGVGIVRQVENEVVEQTGQPTETFTSTSLLRRYYLMR